MRKCRALSNNSERFDTVVIGNDGALSGGVEGGSARSAGGGELSESTVIMGFRAGGLTRGCAHLLTSSIFDRDLIMKVHVSYHSVRPMLRPTTTITCACVTVSTNEVCMFVIFSAI